MNVLLLKNGDKRPLEPVRRDWFAAETGPPSPVIFTAFQANQSGVSSTNARIVSGALPSKRLLTKM
jgi:hypothetical protein